MPRFNEGLASLEASARNRRRSATHDDELTFVLDHFPRDVRVHLDSALDVLREVASEGYLRFDGKSLALGDRPFPLPQQGLEVQLHSSLNKTMCRLAALYTFFGLAVLVLAVTVIIGGFYLCSTPAAGLGVGMVLVGVLIAFVAYIVTKLQVPRMREFCGDVFIPRIMSWQPGSAPVFMKSPGGWAE